MLKIGDRVVCINPGIINRDRLDVNSTYIVLHIVNFNNNRLNGARIRISNDTNMYYKMSRFISLKEQRNKKLNQLICSK